MTLTIQQLLVSVLLLLSIVNAATITERSVSYSGSSSGNDACHVDGAAKYVRAVITHTKRDADAIPTTEDVHRDEGPPGLLITTAYNRKQLLLSSVAGPQAIFGGPLYKNQQPIYTVINSTTVQANYTIVSGLLNGTVPLTTAKIEEYFTYPDAQSCLIDYIKAIFYIGQT